MAASTPSGRGFDHIVLAVPDLDAAAAQYERFGFTLTPRAQHAWGTANRLVQFAGGNFIELLEIDRPELIFEHDQGANPRTFSFGAHIRDVLARGPGMSMLVLQGSDSRGDVERYRSAGLETYEPFDFERAAVLPDGSSVTVAFSLAFTTHPAMPRVAFFTCHNKFPEHFWKPAFQQHANGAEGMVEVVMVAESPDTFADFLSGFSGGAVTKQAEQIAIGCGAGQLIVMTPAGFATRYPGERVELPEGPCFGAVVIAGQAIVPRVISSAEGFGLVVDMRRAEGIQVPPSAGTSL